MARPAIRRPSFITRGRIWILLSPLPGIPGISPWRYSHRENIAAEALNPQSVAVFGYGIYAA